jgi:hypothetical protein
MANDATFTMTFKVREDGSLALAEKQINKAGKAVTGLGNAQVAAGKQADDHYSKQNKGIIGTANSTKSFAKLSQTIGDGNNGLVGAYAALAANAFAVSAAFSALNNAAQAESLLQGLEAQGARTGKTLSVLSSRLKDITKDSISTTEAMRATAQGSTSGISSADLEKLTKVAYEASLALGRDVPDSLNRMMLAVTKMEPELVDELGLTTKITEASEKYARQNNITVGSMTQMQKQQALLNAWVEQGTLKFGGLAEEVDPNPYNQLASTFDNLIKSGLGIINVLLKPLVSFLSSSQMILLGFSTLFVSSIRGQIIPGLQDASKTALKAAENNKKAAVTELEGQKTLAGGKRKAINDYILAAKQGQATQDQYDAARKESEAREKASIDRNAKNKEKVQEAEIARRRSLESIQKTQSKVLLEEAKAQGFAASEGVGLANSKQKLGETVKALSNSFTVNYNSAKTSEKGLKGLLGTATATGKGIAAAGKVAAIGFLNFLPVIGQVIAVVSILWEFIGRPVFNKLTGQTEDTIKAFEEFNTVLDSTSKKIDGLKKIEASTASAADRAVAAVKNQSATIYELADAYVAVYEARQKADKEDSSTKERVNERLELQKKLIEATNKGDAVAVRNLQNQQKLLNNANRLGVSSGTQAAQAFQNEASGLWLSDDAEAAAQYLDNLEKQLPGVAKAFYDAQGGAKKFNQLDTDKKLAAIAQQAGITSTALRRIESGFDSLSKSISGINTGYTDFIKSITPTTAYDTIIDKFKSFKTSFREVNAAIEDSGSIGASTTDLNKRLSETLTGFKGDARNIFSLDVQANLSVFDDVDLKLQNLKAEQAKYNEGTKEYSALANQIGPVEDKRSKIMTAITPLISKQVQDYNKLLANAQEQSILAQGNLAIAQAQLNVIQKQGIVTGDDVARQMKAENAIIALQVEQLKIQKTFLDIDLQKQRNRLKELEDTLELLKSLKDITAEKEKQNIEDQISILRTQVKTDSNDPKKATSVAAAEGKIVSLEQAKENSTKEQLRLKDAISDQQDTIRVGEAQSVTLQKQMTAALMQGNSALEISVARKIKNLENEKESLAIQRETRAVRDSITKSEAESLSLLTMANDSTARELANIGKVAQQKRDSLSEEFDIRQQILNLEIKRATGRGNKSQIDYYTNLRDIEKERNTAAESLVDAEERGQRIALAAFKSEEDRLNLKKEVLNIEQQIVSAATDAIKAQKDYNLAVFDLMAKRKGIENTEAVQYRRQVQAAQDALDIAKAEAEGKIAIIRLEFALLKAKRDTMLADIESRSKVLADERKDIADKLAAAKAKKAEAPITGTAASAGTEAPGDIVVSAKQDSVEGLTARLAAVDTQINTFNEASTRLGKVTNQSIDRAETNAVDTVQKALDTLGINLQKAMEGGLKSPDSLIAMFNNVKNMGDNVKAGLMTRTEFVTEGLGAFVNQMKESLQTLGPQGEIVLAIGQSAVNISNSFQDTFAVLADAGASAGEKVAAVASAISSVIGGVMSILNATSKAKIENIDKEISAEEKRDGKSAASVAKLDALEKKKDGIARKQFNTNKKLMMAQAVMSTAAGVAGALASSAQVGPIAAAILAGMIGAMGLAQIAIISGTQYESSYTPKAASMPTNLSIGKRSDTVDLAKGPNASAGGEVAYLRGSQGTGSNASNYRTIGSAYGGELMRGYGNRGFVVGEKGPEVITPETPISVTPANDVGGGSPINANFSINAIDSQGIQDVLVSQKGNIIKMLREAANASGKTFMEDVNVNVYTRPSVGKL